MFEDYSKKDSVVIVYTGNGKGKTSASLGLIARALGAGWKIAYVQFIKHWDVSEHKFMRAVKQVYGPKLQLIKGGKGFYKAGKLSAKGVTDKQHIDAALKTFNKTMELVSSGRFNLVVCDEISNCMHDGLLTQKQVEKLITARHPKTSLCLTGRHFPKELLKHADIATDMRKLKHHFDDKFLAQEGIDY